MRRLFTFLLLVLTLSPVLAVPPMKWGSLMLMKSAAEKGDHEAQYLIGLQYKAGDGVARDPVEAKKWLLAAAESGHAGAQSALGSLQADTGEEGEAAKWLQAAAEQGDPQAMVSLGDLYGKQTNLSAEPTAGLRWYLAAAQAGNLRAMITLAGLYAHGSMGAPRNPEQSLQWYREAALRGDPDAKMLVARVEALTVIARDDSEKALKASRVEAAKGDQAAALAVALLEQNKRTMDEDPAETVRWSLLLSGLRGGDAYFLRGFMLENGIVVNGDRAAAVANYRKAADLAHPQGRYRLGLMLAAGEGVAKNPLEAGYWLGIAAKQGVVEAREALVKLEQDLPASQRAAIERALP